MKRKRNSILVLWREYEVDYQGEKIAINMEEVSVVENHPRKKGVCRIYLKAGAFFLVRVSYDTVKGHLWAAGVKIYS